MQTFRLCLLAVLFFSAPTWSADKPDTRTDDTVVTQADPSAPVSLLECLERALQRDPVYAAARARRDAASEERTMARAGLLPSLSLSARAVSLDTDSDTPFYSGSAEQTGDSTALTLSQTLYDGRQWAAFRQGDAASRAGEAARDAALQTVYERVVQSYLSLARFDSQRKTLLAQEAAIAGLLSQAQQLYKGGEGTLTDIDEARARLDALAADAIALDASRQTAAAQLSRLTGTPVRAVWQPVSTLPDDSPVGAGQTVEGWWQRAREASPILREQEWLLEQYRAALRQAQAGHEPTLDLTAQRVRSRQELDASAELQTTRYVGLTLGVPLYAGGSVSASARRAMALVEAQRAEIEATQNALQQDIESRFLGIASNYQRMRAMSTAVASAERALNSTRKGFDAGIRSTSDILDAQQRVFATRQALLEAKFDMLDAWALLRTRSGTMTHEALAQLQALY